MSVYDSTSGIWSDWQTIGSTIMQSSGVWSYHGVDITGYAGKKVRVVFYYQGGGGPGWYIDDVEITGISTEPTPTLTPNPSPTPAITPTPTATPTPVPCKPENMTTDSKKMQITQGSSELVTITVTCEDGTPVAGETVKAKVEFKGKKGRSEDEGKGRGFRIRMKEK